MDRTAVAHAPFWSNVYVRLGRVSNLPTVWTNVIAGAVLGGGALAGGSVVATAIAMSCSASLRTRSILSCGWASSRGCSSGCRPRAADSHSSSPVR